MVAISELALQSRPSITHMLHAALTHWVARAGPCAHLCESLERVEALGLRLIGTRAALFDDLPLPFG